MVEKVAILFVYMVEGNFKDGVNGRKREKEPVFIFPQKAG